MVKPALFTPQQDRSLGQAIKALDHVDFPQAFSHFVAKVIDFDNLIVIAYHKNHNPHVLYRECKDPKVYSTMDSHYIKAAYLLDPFYQAVQEGLQGGVYQIFELAPINSKRQAIFWSIIVIRR